MADSRESSSSSVQAGGAATSAGIIFQQQVGALFGACLLSEERVDERLNLGAAVPVWLRFETEAPVDDILVCTSNDGYIAIQAKTTVSLSQDLTSPFGKTVSQFVRHWIACRGGDESRGWNRPLDPARDRLVLAVSAGAPATVREHLPAALRQRAQPGPAVLTKARQKALDEFDSCVAQAWRSVTSEEPAPDLLDQLAGLVTVFVFNPSGADRTLTQKILAASLSNEAEAATALNALETACGQMMAQRGGADLASLRQKLMTEGVNLAGAPRYQQDIAALGKHTRSVADSLHRHEAIEVVNGERVSIVRECQEVVEAAAREGSLLIIGEPGAGKSSVLNALVHHLLEQGKDVLELAVDQHSVESLEGLSKDLKLEHGLLEVLEAWDGTGPGWLIIDALDATRGGKGEGVFRTLITQVLERCQRWHVVASIRTFDLRMGQQFRSLFTGAPPSPDLAESEFSNVRHISIPRWSKSELQQLLDQAPTLSDAFANAPSRLRELATVPFNTRLLGELIADNVSMVELNRVSSQAELLGLYWERRIERHGTPAQLCLRGMVEAMVDTRVLRVQKHAVASNDPATIDTLSYEGVLIAAGNDQWVQFRHHILFDFAAARVMLDPFDIVKGTQRFPKAEARGLMLAPALAFVLQEIWDEKTNRDSFWTAVGHILADEDGDPVIRSAVARISAEYPIEAVDTRSLAGRIAAGDGKAIGALSYLSGALAIRLEDDPDTPTEPWIRLLAASASNVAPVADPVRFLLFQFIERTQDAALRSELGLAARALLEHGYGLEELRRIVPAAIGFVADTYDTDPEASRRLLSRVFDEDRFLKFGWEEVPAVCRKIESIAIADPAFGVEIYRRTYEYDVTEDRETPMGSSQILSLRSNARQDYDMARYTLGEFIPTFLDKHPSYAIEAIVAAVEGYVTREQSIPKGFREQNLTIAGKNIRLRADLSYIWARDPENKQPYDAEVLIAKLLERLRFSEEEVVIYLADLLIDKASFAVFWSRLFMAAAERNDALADLLLPFALAEQFLVMPDTRKDAIDVVAAGYERLVPEKRGSFERQALAFDFSEFEHIKEAGDGFLRRLFSTIGRDALVTDDARALIVDIDQETERNERLFVIRSSRGDPEPYFWIPDLDQNHPANADLVEAINSAKKALALESDAQAPSGLTLDDAYRVLGRVEQSLRGDGVNPQLKIYGEGVIGQACVRIVERKLLSSETDALATETFLRFLDIATTAAGPEVDDDTERAFEKSWSWGSPAARVEAAQAVLDLVLQRPDLLPRVLDRIDTLLADPHPAVRMQAGWHLIRIWGRREFWERLEARLAEETNLGVLEYLLNEILDRVLLHKDPARIESLILELLKRFPGDNERQGRLRKAVSGHLAILWVRYERQAARSVIDTWIAEPARYHDELTGILSTMRETFLAGLVGQREPGDDAQRHRAFDLATAIVEAASKGLAVYYASDTPNDSDKNDARELAQLLNVVCRELYFSTPARSHGRASDHRPPSVIELSTFFDEAAPILQRIGDYATPHTVYYLLQLLEFLLPFDPERAFDLAAHVLRNGGKDTGFQFESLGADLIVRLVGVFLADHREIFENEERRMALIECLEIFMKAGWPAAQRLLYRLPDLIQ